MLNRPIALALAVLLATPAFASTPPQPPRAPAIAKLSRAQLTLLADSVFARLLVVVDQAGLQVTPANRDILHEAVFNGLDHYLSRTDLLSLNEGEQALALVVAELAALGAAIEVGSKIEAVSTAGTAISNGIFGGAAPTAGAGSAFGAGFQAEVTTTIAYGSVQEVLAVGGGFVGAALAGIAVGAIADGLITKNVGRSGVTMGESLAESVESADQADLDKLVAAVKADAEARAKYEEEQRQKEEDEAKAKEEEDKEAAEGTSSSSDGSPPAEGSSTSGSGGTPNPDATGATGSVWVASGGAVGNKPELPKPDEGVKDPVDVDGNGVPVDPITGEPLPVADPDSHHTDGREPPDLTHLGLREDLLAILMHGKLPLILFTPEMLAKFRAPLIEVRRVR